MRFAIISLFLVACGASPDAVEPPTEPIEEPAAEPVVEPAAEPAAPVAEESRLNVNTADEDTLKALPGVTDRMAHEFEEYRPYVSITQFRAEIGKYVDEATVAGYEQLIYVPIQFNECDAATLMQIPGLELATAEQIMAQRPFASEDAFITALEAMASDAVSDAAKTLLASE